MIHKRCFIVFSLLISLLLNVSCFNLYTSIIDQSGNFIKKDILGHIDTFQEGYAVIYVHKYEKYGFINHRGELLNGLIYEKAKNFQEGLAAVKKNGLWGFIDKQGNEVIGFNHKGIMYRGQEFTGPFGRGFSEGLCDICINGRWGFIDKEGNIAIEPVFEWVYEFKSGLAMARENGLYGYINKKGDWVINPTYRFANSFSGNIAPVSFFGVFSKPTDEEKEMFVTGSVNQTFVLSDKIHSNYWGLIDRQGNIVSEARFDNILPFKNGLAVVVKNYKYGFIDKTGKVVIPIIYDSFGTFSEGIAPVKKGSKYGGVDRENTVVIPFIYDDLRPFKNGLARVEIKNKYGYIDKKNQIIIPIKFNMASDFGEDHALTSNY
jgi:hypothetical protein